LWDLLQHVDHHSILVDFHDGCEHITKVLKTPIVGPDSYIGAARFAMLWRLKNSVEYDSHNRPIFDQVVCFTRIMFDVSLAPVDV
jgi:hypothetical protein